jgi:hypothetical protein
MIHWTGERVNKKLTSKAGETVLSVQTALNGIVQLSGVLQAARHEEVSMDLLLAKITGSNSRSTRRGRSATLVGRKEKQATLGRKTNLVIEDETKMIESLRLLCKVPPEGQDVMEEGAPTVTWLALEYVSDSIDHVRLCGTGSGLPAHDEYKVHCNPTNKIFVVHTVMHMFHYQKNMGGNLHKPYYGCLLWCGLEVPIVEKTLAAHHFNAFLAKIKQQLTRWGLNLQGGSCHAEQADELDLGHIKQAMALRD